MMRVSGARKQVLLLVSMLGHRVYAYAAGLLLLRRHCLSGGADG